MIKLINITDDAHQNHTIQLPGGGELILTLRYVGLTEMWFFDATYNDTQMYGYKLSVGVPHLLSRNMPFDLWCVDTSGDGVDPIRADDFLTGRCELFVLTENDMLEVRGAPVPA